MLMHLFSWFQKCMVITSLHEKTNRFASPLEYLKYEKINLFHFTDIVLLVPEMQGCQLYLKTNNRSANPGYQSWNSNILTGHVLKIWKHCSLGIMIKTLPQTKLKSQILK